MVQESLQNRVGLLDKDLKESLQNRVGLLDKDLKDLKHKVSVVVFFLVIIVIIVLSYYLATSRTKWVWFYENSNFL